MGSSTSSIKQTSRSAASSERPRATRKLPGAQQGGQSLSLNAFLWVADGGRSSGTAPLGQQGNSPENPGRGWVAVQPPASPYLRDVSAVTWSPLVYLVWIVKTLEKGGGGGEVGEQADATLTPGPWGWQCGGVFRQKSRVVIRSCPRGLFLMVSSCTWMEFDPFLNRLNW